MILISLNLEKNFQIASQETVKSNVEQTTKTLMPYILKYPFREPAIFSISITIYFALTSEACQL